MIIVVLISQKTSFASCTSWGSSIPRSPCCLLCSGILVLSRNDQSNSISAIEQHARSLLFFRAISYVSGCLPCPFHTLRGMTNTTLLPAPHPVPYIPGFELQWFYSLIRNHLTTFDNGYSVVIWSYSFRFQTDLSSFIHCRRFTS